MGITFGFDDEGIVVTQVITTSVHLPFDYIRQLPMTYDKRHATHLLHSSFLSFHFSQAKVYVRIAASETNNRKPTAMVGKNL